MKKAHKVLLTVGLTALLAGVTAVQANEPRQSFHCRPGQNAADCEQQRLDRFAQRLDLTDAQKKQVQDIYTQYRPEREKLQQALRDNRKTIDAMSASDPQLATVAGKQGQALGQMIVLHKKIEAAVDAVLTPQQRDKLAQMKQHRGWAGHERTPGNPAQGISG